MAKKTSDKMAKIRKCLRLWLWAKPLAREEVIGKAETFGFPADMVQQAISECHSETVDGVEYLSIKKAAEGADGENAPEPITLGEVLEALEEYISRYVYLSAEQRTIVVLWAAASLAAKHFDKAPVLAVSALTHGLGKTDLLRIVAGLTGGILEVSPTAAGIYRVKTEAPRFFDEFQQDVAAQIDALINASFTRGATITRMDKDMRPQQYDCWGFKAFAFRGEFNFRPDTLSRCLRVHIQPKPKKAKIGTYDQVKNAAELGDYRTLLAETMQGFETVDFDAEGRFIQKWGPLAQVANFAGGDWGKRLIAALDAAGPPAPDQKVKLLRDALGKQVDLGGKDFSAEALATALKQDQDLDWEHLNGRWLSGRFKDLGIHGKRTKFGRIYAWKELQDASARL